MKYLIHLAPPQALCERIERFRKEQGLNPLPSMLHCTIYSIHAEPEYESELVARLQGIADETSPFDVSTSGIAMFSDGKLNDNVVVLKLVSPALQRLHERVIESLYSFNTRFKPLPQGRFSPDQEAFCRKYGVQFCGTYYNPHISIAVSSQMLVTPPEIYSYSWDAHTIHLSRKEALPDARWQLVRAFALNGR